MPLRYASSITLSINKSFLLTAIWYDCYVVICNPLRYSIIMNKVCLLLVWGACAIALVVAMTQVPAVFRLPFCTTKVTHFCDIWPVMELSFTNSTLREILTLIISMLVLLIAMSLIFIFYILIISTILKIASAEGRALQSVLLISQWSLSMMDLLPLPTSNLSQRTPGMRTN